ncbi:hypothetical protein DY000_02009432 [Brassica cretica]|uniref:Uncharacterized protein n=1 Tax=Brassica cretica TaxID=69181 RepID=A0ABQ7CHL3_BRACR|nr:hypothetical protein DY000_02009432 [Brassica cretica]
MWRSKSTTSALGFSVRDDRSGYRYTGRLLRVLRPTVYRNPPKTTIETHQRRRLLRVLSASDGRLLRLLSSSPQEEQSNPTTEDDSVGKSRRKQRSSLVISARRAIETHPPPTMPLSILIFGNVDNCGRQRTSLCIGFVSTRHNGDNLIFRQGEDVQQVMQPSKLRNHNSNLKLSVSSQATTNLGDQPTKRPPGVKAAKGASGKRSVVDHAAVSQLQSMWTIRDKDLAMKERLTKMGLLDRLLSKKNPYLKWRKL